MRVVPASAVAAALLLAACSRAGEEESGKRAPIAPPPPVIDIPQGLNIPVEVDGQAAPAITRATLAGLEPDFADAERRAWRLSRILPSFTGSAVVVEAVGRDGVSITMTRPETADEPQPVLFFTRRGEVVATQVRPEDPFPQFHGQGGRLRRPGDLTPRVSPVVKLRVHASGMARSPAPP